MGRNASGARFIHPDLQLNDIIGIKWKQCGNDERGRPVNGVKDRSEYRSGGI